MIFEALFVAVVPTEDGNELVVAVGDDELMVVAVGGDELMVVAIGDVGGSVAPEFWFP